MSPSRPVIDVTLQDLGMAYRKAKVDLFYSSRVCRRELCEFEENLIENLAQLKEQLSAGEIPMVPEDAWTLVPKKITPQEPTSDLITSDPARRWASIIEDTSPIAEFRLMEALPIAFHVFATLWIHKVGHKFEAKLSDAARGNRLGRRADGSLNLLSLGSTTPYRHAYTRWRDEGLAAMRDALDQDKSVVAITADVQSFFHQLDPSFMLDADFIAKIGVKLSDEERALHERFIEALVDWAGTTPLGRGLPVGLVASSLIANVALFELDRIVEREVVPLYYGRYVDDIILVMENSGEFSKPREIWDWLCGRSDGALSWEKDGNGADVVCFTRSYLSNSKIRFANEKNKTFVLSGQAGKTLLASIEHQIRTRTSEWRSLPELPSESTQIESRLLTAIQANGEAADGLHRTDTVSVRRAVFALRIRDIEAYNRALPPEAWVQKRHGFLDAFIRHILVLPPFFDFFNYLSRVVELACSCADFGHLRQIIDALEQLLKELDKCDVTINPLDIKTLDIKTAVKLRETILSTFRKQLRLRVSQSIEASFPGRLLRAQSDGWKTHFGHDLDLFEHREIGDLQRANRKYFERDLAARPLKQLLLPREVIGGAALPVGKKLLVRLKRNSAPELLGSDITEGVTTLSRVTRIPGRKEPPFGLLFPTRPPGVHELYLLHPRPYSSGGANDIATCLLALRGFKPEGKLPGRRGRGENPPIEIPFGDQTRHKLRIAVASWKTDRASWMAAVTRNSDPDGTRLDRLNRLLNAVLRCRERPDYLILPELSIPPRWFLAIAGKLQGKGISLICGVEYQHARHHVVRSQIWTALSYDGLGFPATMIYRQDKQRPAPHEETRLTRVGGRVLRPKVPWTLPPILDHGGFHFSLLLCSELTNIRHRAALRGNIDALFVPEWNRDTESFGALVESASLDMHAYVIQCNDRQYGDSRIRVPHKNAWERDVVRVKGGLQDYFVVGEVDVLALRQFQSNHRSPDQPFKPVPDGFEISRRRKVLPK